MADTLIEAIEFRARSPKVALPGLDDALSKLKAIDAALNAVNGRLAGLSTGSVFKRTKAEMADVLRGISQGTRKIVPVKDMAKALGIPDQKDFDSFIANFKARNKGKLQSIFASERVGGMGGASQRIAGFASAEKAAQVAQSYFKQAFKTAKDPVAAMQALFGGGGGPSGLAPGRGSGSIPLVVPASQIVATLGPGTISLMVPAGQVTGTGSGGVMGGGSAGGKGGGGGAAGGGAGMAPGGASGNVIEEKITTTASGARKVQRRELVSAGKTLDKFYKDVGGVLEPLKEVEGSNFAKAAKVKLENQTAALKRELMLQESGERDPAKLAALYRKQAAQMRALVTGKSGAQLQKLGLLPEINRVMGQSAGLRGDAAGFEEKAGQQAYRKMIADMKRVGQMRQTMHKAQLQGDKEEAKRLAEADRQAAASKRDWNRYIASGAKSDATKAAMQGKVQTFTTKQSQAAAFRQATYAGADYAWQDFLGSGGRMMSSTQKGATGSRVLVGEREVGGQIERMTVSYGRAGAEVTRLTKTMTEARKEGGYLAGDFIKNTAKVTLWAASVGVLYKSLELVAYSLGRLVEISPQVGRLEQVFKGVGGSAQELTVDILELAAANGADTHAAMEAAIQWSRLGLTRVQVTEAVRMSMIAANVAQIDSLEATEKLQGMMQAYGLTLSQLHSALGELVAITNTYNVSTADMLTGLTRVASVAKQTGMPLAELQGLLGATVGTTAQSGANIGNMMKSVMLALSNPRLQKLLRESFQVEVTSGGQDLKGMSEMLRDLYVRYEELNDAQRQSMLFSVAGKTQASRLSAMLDSYVQAQVLAVNAQLALNTAEMENIKIKDALRARLIGVRDEWERFILQASNRGPTRVLEELADSLKNVLSLMGSKAGSLATVGMMGIMTAASMKVAMTGMTMQAAAGAPGFLGRTGARVMATAAGLNNYVNMAANQFAAGGKVNLGFGSYSAGMLGELVGKTNLLGQSFLNVARSSQTMSGSVRLALGGIGVGMKGLAVAAAGLSEFLAPMVAIAAGIYVFNQSMEAIGMTSTAATQRLAGLNTEVEKFSSAAAAAKEAADLFKTLERVLPNQRSDEDRRKLVLKAAEATHGDIENTSARAKAVAQTQEEWLLLLKQGEALQGNARYAAINTALEKERAVQLQANFDRLQDEYEARKRAIESNEQEIDRLNKAQKTWGVWFGGNDTRKDKITELTKANNELHGKQTQTVLDQAVEDSLEERLKYDTKIATALEVQKTALQGIADLYNTIATHNPLEKAMMQIASLGAQSRHIDLRLAALHSADLGDAMGQQAREQAREKLQGEEKTLRDQYAAADKHRADIQGNRQTVGTWDPIYSRYHTADQAAKDAKNKVENNLADQRQVQEGFLPGVPVDDTVRRMKERQDLIEEQRQLDAKRQAQEANLRLFEMQTRVQFGREEAGRELSPHDVGRDETQKLQNKQDFLRKQIEAEVGTTQTPESKSRTLEQENQLYETQAELRKRQFDIEKDINQLIVDRRKEFEHSLLGAGPGELLRKLAGFSMAAGGTMTAGQFLSLSPDIRKDVGMVDTRFDTGMMDLRREQNREPQQDAGTFEQGQLDISKKIAALGADLAKLIPDTSTYDAAVKVVGGFTSALDDATRKVVAFANSLTPVGGASGSWPGAQPRNPQAGGVGAGVGVMEQ